MFVNLQIKDIVDIILVALLLYYTYKLMKSSGAINIFTGVMTLLLVWVVVTRFFEMQLLGSILDAVVNVGGIALIVLFQDDIRRFLLMLGSRKGWWSRFSKYFSSTKELSQDVSSIMSIVLACRNMSKTKTGALIVVERTVALTRVIETGEVVDATISARLLENIFFKNSPLHDGAMIISNNRIKAAGCILPVAHDIDIPKSLGLRHRAALGISKESDALVVIVSEETGKISVARRGKFKLQIPHDELERLLSEEY